MGELLMRKIFAAAAAVTVAVALSCTGGTTTARADTKSFKDPKPHITKVTVNHGATNIKITTKTGKYRIGSYFIVYLDTDPANPGPEFRNDIYPNSEVAPLKRVEKFGQQGKTAACDGLRASADAFGPKKVTLTVPRSCVGDPSKVRVSVRGYFDVKGPNVIDWAPGKKKFTGWVRR